MNLEELEKPIQNIITLIEKIDEKYREKCFEILLSFYLREKLQLPIEPKVLEKKKELEGGEKEVTLPIDVRAFLQTHGIPDERLQELFLIEKNEVRPIYKITTTKKAEAQMQVALLMALKNAMRTQGKFEFSIESVRQRCKDLQVYDLANFKRHFKNNKSLFKDFDDSEHIELSADGRTELAEVVSKVATK